MKKIIASSFLFLFVMSGLYFTKALNANVSCTMHMRSGWNLMSIGELSCGFFSIQSNPNNVGNFPAYLDLYAYEGGTYIYTRVKKDNLSTAEGAFEKYLGNNVKKITNNEFTKFDSEFENKVEQEVRQNDIPKIKEYAGRTAKEVFTSVWVYNPGKEFSVEFTSKNGNEEAIMVSIVNSLFTDMSSQDISQTIDSIASDFLPEIIREIEREKGYQSFLKESVSGSILLDSGWNFLSYSRLMSEDNGEINLSRGDCSITKAYVFNNDSKKWVNVNNANRSMIGSGVVVYNSGGTCRLLFENSILTRLRSLLSGGPASGNMPPQLPIGN